MDAVEQHEELYTHSFFDKELRDSRKLLLKTLVLPILYTTLLIWACLSLYWGSTTSSSLRKIKVYAVNFDDGDFGSLLLQGIKKMSEESPNSVEWTFDVEITSPEMSENLVLNEQAWAVVQVNANVSSSLESSLKGGIISYNPSSAVSIYYASGRNQITSNSKMLPAILAFLNPILAQIDVNSTDTFISSHATNATALRTALHCPGCLSMPFAAQQQDLRPFDVPTATGTTMVGLIFLLTFSFNVFQILRTNGELFGFKLKLSSALYFRIINSFLGYLLISLSYSLINLAFGVPMNRFYGHAGFIIFWMLNFCTMAALGLPMESLFTLIGLKWAGYFLSFWIIVNVAGSFQSFEVMPGFYKYGYAVPFFNSIQGARTIIFGTKSHLGLNFGILLVWMAAGLLGMSILTAWTLRRNRRKGIHVTK